jgi:two-component sensor histidine kinase
MKMLRVFETALPENLLVREILHEVNNDFASAVRLVSLTAAQSSSGDAVALDVVGGRLKKSANVHHAAQMPMSDGRLEGPARSLDAPFDCRFREDEAEFALGPNRSAAEIAAIGHHQRSGVKQ